MEEINSLNLGKQQMAERKKDLTNNITSIAKGKLAEDKPSLFKMLKDGLFNGDPKTAMKHVKVHIIEPAIRSMIYQGIQGFFSAWIFGADSKSSAKFGASSLDDYTNFFTGTPKKKKSGTGDVAERCAAVIFETREEAENVKNYLQKFVGTYGTVTAYNYFEAAEVPCDYTMKSWGWNDLSGIYIYQGPEGWSIELPDPKPIKTIE